MSMPISGQGPINQKPIQQSSQKADASPVKAAMEAMTEAMEIFDTEVQGVTKDQIKKDVPQNSLTTQQTKEKTPSSFIPEGAVAAMVDDDELDIKKKKEKKEKLSKFEEKMNELDGLSQVLDPEKLKTEEEKGILEKFKENLKTIRNLRRELKQTREQKEKYLQIIDANKRNKGK